MKVKTKAHLGMISGIFFTLLGFLFFPLFILGILMIVFAVITFSKASKE